MRTTLDDFQAIADPSRREILLLLTKEKQTINALAGNFDISRPAISKHVKVLYDAGLIMINNQGRERYCELRPDGFDGLKEWLDYFDKFWHSKLQNLENLLNQRKNENN